MSRDLDTGGKVLEWAHTANDLWPGADRVEGAETAAYLACAVRAYEILKRDAPLYDPEGEYCRLHDVLAEAEGGAPDDHQGGKAARGLPDG